MQASASSSEQEPSSSTAEQPVLLRDPEARLRSYGAFFGKTFKLPAWLDEVPRVRVRTISQRAQDDLVDLVVLNERLSGEINPWEARTRLELLRKKRKNWEHIYNYVTKADAAATLALIEEANEQVRESVCTHCLHLQQQQPLLWIKHSSTLCAWRQHQQCMCHAAAARCLTIAHAPSLVLVMRSCCCLSSCCCCRRSCSSARRPRNVPVCQISSCSCRTCSSRWTRPARCGYVCVEGCGCKGGLLAW